MADQEQQQISAEKETSFMDPLASNTEQAPLLEASSPEAPSPEVPAPGAPSPEAPIREEGKEEKQAKDPTLSLSDELVDMGGVLTVMNGLQLRMHGQELPFASFTYALPPTVEKPSPVDWKILVSEDVQSQHIRCHELRPEDNLPQLVAQYQQAYAVATVVINSEDSHTLNPSYLQGVSLGSYPILVLTQQDGRQLLKLLDQYGEQEVEGRVDVESMVDPLTQTAITSPPKLSKPVKEPGHFQKLKQLFGGREKRPSVDLKEIKKLVFPQAEPPAIVSEDAGLFSHIMSYFQQYEKTAKPEGSHTDVNDTLKMVQRNSQYIMGRDFPFYLLLAYRMHLKTSLYMCDEHGNFILGCIDAMEAMKPHLIASTFNSFLQRRDFSIMFGDENMGVFQLLEMACLELAKVATRRGTGQARMYTRFVFCRMMWVSLALKLRSERMIVTRSTSNIWKEHFTKHHQQITLSDDIISDLKEGLEFGQLVHLPSDLCFNAQQMGDLLVSEGFVRPFRHIKQFVEVVESYIPLELEFFNLVTTLRAVYDSWLRQTSSNKFSYASITGTRSAALREGLEFLDSLAEVWERRGFNGQLFDAECVRWLLLLLWLVDITGESPALHLHQFLKGRGVVKRYRQRIRNHVIEETQKNFAKLTIQQFFPLYKEFRIWPNKFLEEFLSGYQVPPNIKISDPTWREFFSEVVSRFTGAHHHYYLLGFLKSVAECYRNDRRAEELVLDLLQLGVPRLFASVGDGGEDFAVQQEMAAFLKDYINRNALKHSILSHMTKIMEAISEERDEFQQLLLGVLQKEVVPEIKALQGSKAVADNNLLPVLHIAVNTLRKDLSWLQALTTRQRFCWGIVACCCSKIPISSDHFEWAHTFSYLISQLGQIFHAYCSSKKLPEDEKVLSSKPPQDILHSPSEDIKRYFEWIQRIQDVLLSWQERFLNHKVNYDDIMLYASYQAQLEELCSIVCVSVASLTAQNLQDVKTTFLQQFEQLNVFLLRYIPGQPDAHWCTLPSLLAEYGVALPPTLLHPISMYILFPGEERGLAGKLLENPLSPTTSPTSQFQPGHEACRLRLSKKISLRSLSALVQELQTFLIPVIEHINVLVFFKLHHSEMFEKYLRLYFRKETAESETTLSHASAGIESFAFSMPVFSSMLPEEEQERDEAVEGLPLPLVERCLARTVNLLLKLMDGTATYSEIIAEGELNLEKLDIEQEFNTLTGFAAFLNRSASQQGLAGVRSMLELFQFTVHIQSIQSVCEQYHLQGCLEDKALHNLLTLVEELKSEANRANLTPLDASQRMLWVKESLCLDKNTNYKCLDLFAAVADSAAFYQFVRDKRFVGEKGQAVFRQQYQLITAQLQHEEYDETVLNHLFAAFKFISPFMNTKQSFRELMTQVSRLDATNGLKQLETVNTNITLIRLWFSRAEGDTLENVANQLNCILDTGFYIFDTTSSGSEIILEYVPTTSRPPQPSTLEMDSTTAQETVVSQGSFTYPRSSQSRSGSTVAEGPIPATSVQRWNSEQISDFVRKLGFQDTEKEGGDRIKHFLHINEIAYKLLSLYQRLKELGHPKYYLQVGGSLQNTLLCGVAKAMAEGMVIDTELILTSWAKRVAELRSMYDWLLFFSVPKLLLLHRLLIEGEKAGPLPEGDRARRLAEVVREVSFLCENTADIREQLLKGVKKSLASCHAAIEAEEAPMHIVGRFLAVLFGNHSLPQRRGSGFGLPRPRSISRISLSSESVVQMLHYCPNYSQAELIQLIVSIYDGVPESFEVFRCRPSSTEEELSLFLKRAAKHPLQFLLLEVNRLPFKLQEYLMQVHLSMQQQVRGEAGSGTTSRAPCIHFIETAPSVLREMPWITLSEHKDSGPSLSFEDARKVCLERAVRPDDFSRIELVYGRAGDGKTHYIQQQLQSRPASLTIAVNEAFSPLNTIRKLRGLPMDRHHCGIFFNFTLLPPGDSVVDSERERHQQLMKAIGWFFFDLLLLGYVEDPETGLSFRIPGSLEWGLYVEVPSYDHVRPGNAYKHFCHDLPTLGLLGTRQYVPPDTPYSVNADVQLVCKYLQAFKKGGVKGIDKLYRENSDQPVKFSRERDLPEKACQDLLLDFMPEHISKTKITQRLFIKYMYRRCSFLDSLPAFNFNSGFGEYVVTEQGRVATDTKQLGSTLMSTMLKEVADFCDPAIRENWSHKPHQQLIYDFKEGGASLGLISLHPDQLRPQDKLRFQRIGVRIPSMTDLYSRSLLDGFLSRALNVELENGRLVPIDDSAYVLTLDYTIKMLDIHERYYCGVPVIIEGETGVGKTALVEMLSKLWNHALLVQWKREYSRLLDFMRRQLGDLSVDSTENYQACLNVVEKLSSGAQVSEQELVMLGQLPDLNTTSGKFYSVLRNHLLSMRNDPVISLLMIEGTGPSLEERFKEANSKDTAEDTAHLLHGILTAQITPTFHKVNVHAAMTPGDIREQFKPVFTQAHSLKEAFQQRDVSQRVASGSPRVPFVTVFLDEVNTSSCLGLFKEIIVDRTFDGEPIPENLFIVAACNPHRGNSLVSHQQTWVRGSYYVRRLHPTLQFLMWDYGSLDEHQERDYINAKMKMLNQRMPNAEVASLTDLIVNSQNLMRQYALEHLKKKCGLEGQEACISSRSCVSQRDIQRVFTFYQWLMDIYQKHEPHSQRPDYSRRAVMVALAIVYYMRLNRTYRKDYQAFMDKERRLPNEVSFSQAFEEELNWYMEQVELPAGIARTQALKENLFATIVCTVTHTPLILVGAPGSSKTLSFNLAIANLKGQESKVRLFRDTATFRSLDPHFYQCSRRTTSNEIQIVFSRAVNRQRSHSRFSLPIYCVVFMDEAGLPEESHESLKVLHYHLDRQEVSFVAITNHVLDAAKTNRAVSLFRPEASREDLETLAKGCLCSTPDDPPPELRKDLETIVQFCTPYSSLMERDPSFSQVFGLRDFIHFVNYLRRRRTQMLTPQLVMEALERNFNGSDNFATISRAFLSVMQNCNINEVHSRSILAILQDSLEDRPQQDITENEVRYKLIIDPSEDDSLTRLLFAFGVLRRDNTRMFVCSDFPGDSQLQKINTIAAIRHSAIQGHTVIMSQTDDIHESFYDLFNQRFRRIDDPQQGPRYYTNIAIGAHLKPCRVDPSFQCVVVVKKSELKATPAPFLNRFEKYCITHRTLLETAMAKLPSCLRILVEAAREKAQQFIDCIGGSGSLYGLKEETLDSLVLTILPPQDHTFHPLGQPSIVDDSCDVRLFLMQELLGALRNCAGFNIPLCSVTELCLDMEQLFTLVTVDPEFEGLLPSLSHHQVLQAVVEAMEVLHAHEEEAKVGVSPEVCLVVAVLEQWLVRYLCKRLTQLMTCEALILHRRQIPSSYIVNYLACQAHFSLRELLGRYHSVLEASGWSPRASPTKLLCFSRSSNLIHQLPALFPTFALEIAATTDTRQTLKDLVFEEPEQLMVCKLSSLPSQSGVQDLLKDFVRSNSARVLLLVANMLEASQEMVNHLRIMIEEAEAQRPQQAKLFVLLLHFPPAQFFDPCYPSLFLHSWDHCYLDTIAHGAVRGVVDICDWFRQCCFPQNLPEEDSLLQTLQGFLPEAIPILSSRVFFGSCPGGTFNCNMNGSQRSQALKQLLFDKGVGSLLCEKFRSYWKPATMAEYLEKAAMFTKNRESTLSITDSIQTFFKREFFDFLVYMVSRINDDFNLDVLFAESCSPAVHQLFLDILRSLSIPRLSQLRALSANPPVSRQMSHVPHFPFFKLVSEVMECVVEISREEANQKANVLAEEPDSLTHSPTHHNQSTILQQVVCAKIQERVQSTPNDCLALALRVMAAHPELWRYYFEEFTQRQLHLESSSGPDNISHKILQAFLGQLHQQEPTARLVGLHLYMQVYQLDLGKMATLLRPLGKLETMARAVPQLLSPQDQGSPTHQFLSVVQQTQYPLGTPVQLSAFIINTLFNALVGSTYGQQSQDSINDKMTVWYKAYRDILMLPTLNQYIYLALEPDGGSRAVEARLNVMHATFLAIQTASRLDEDSLIKGQLVFQTLFSRHFSEDLKVKDECPRLDEVMSVAVEVICETNFSPSVHRDSNRGRLLMEGLFAHFFSPHRPNYHADDCRWFLELANTQRHWQPGLLEQSVVAGGLGDDLVKELEREQPSGLLQLPQADLNMNVFKLYLARILGNCDQRTDSAMLSGPLLLYRPQWRAQVGQVLVSQEELGPPAPFLPSFYQDCPPLTPEASSEDKLMQQPLAHLYFLIVMEHLHVEEHRLSSLVKTAATIQQLLLSEVTPPQERVLLHIEQQAVLQMVLGRLAVHLQPDQRHTIGEVNPLLADINSLLDDPALGGGVVQGHSMVLGLHLLRKLKSWRKFSELLSQQYDSVCRGINCLQPLHLQLKAPSEACAHLFPFMLPGGEGSELGVLYREVARAMMVIHRGQGDVSTLVRVAKGAPTRGSIDRRMTFRMMIWLVTYYEFFDKKVCSDALCNVMGGEDMEEYLREDSYIRLIQCFLNPELMLKNPEPPNVLRDDQPIIELTPGGGYRPRPRDGKREDPLHLLFQPEGPQQQDQSDVDLCHSLANLVAVVLGSPSRSNHLWYHLFHPQDLRDTYMTGFMYNNKISSDGLLYDCGVELTPEGQFGRQDYLRHASRGTFTLHSFYLLLWANFGAFCMALLTQPEADAHIHGPLISDWQAIRHYCVSQVKTVWMHMRNNLGISDEERSFLLMRCCMQFYDLLNTESEVSGSLRGVLNSREELDSYERLWHTHIYQPSWKELKPKFAQYSHLWQGNQLLLDLRRLELRYPHFPMERDFTHSVLSSGDIQQHSEGGDLRLLSQFTLEWPRLQAGGLLLPDLVEFYQWLHMHLAHMVTYHQATTLPIRRVVELASRRSSREGAEHITALYNRIKTGYNAYVEMIGGAIGVGACAAVRQGNKIYTIEDDIPLLHFLSDTAEEEEGNDWLYIVVAYIVTAHNSFLEGLYSLVHSQPGAPLARLLADEPAKIFPTEVNDSHSIVGRLNTLHGLNELLQLIRSRHHPPTSTPAPPPPQPQAPHMSIMPSSMPTLQLSTSFQLAQLQEDIISLFIAGKPLIESPTHLRTPFRFRLPLDQTQTQPTSAVGCGDLTDVEEKLPDSFKSLPDEAILKRLEYEFHAAGYHTMVEVVTGLRTLAGHLIKALLEASSSAALEQQSVVQFLLVLFDPLGGSRNVLGEVGLRSPSPQQLACLAELPLTQLFGCLQKFVVWVEEGVYDFCDLPFNVKSHISYPDQQALQQIPLRWTGTHTELLEELRQMSEVLLHSEAHILKTVHDHAQKPVVRYLQEIHSVEEDDRLPGLIPHSILLQHYVDLRLALRRLVSQVQHQLGAEGGVASPTPLWQELVADLWDKRLPHLREDADLYGNEAFVFDPYTGRYGFEDGSDVESEGELIDDLIQEEEKSPATLPEESFAVIPEEEVVPAVVVKLSGEEEVEQMFEQNSEFREKVLSMARSMRADTETLEHLARDYGVDEVGEFFTEVGLGQYTEAFQEALISGEELLEADKEFLEELGVKSAIDRLKMKELFRRKLQGAKVKLPVADVVDFLQQNKLDKYVATFQQHSIDGDLLLAADDNLLKELGIKSAVDRVKIRTRFKTFASSK